MVLSHPLYGNDIQSRERWLRQVLRKYARENNLDPEDISLKIVGTEISVSGDHAALLVRHLPAPIDRSRSIMHSPTQ